MKAGLGVSGPAFLFAMPAMPTSPAAPSLASLMLADAGCDILSGSKLAGKLHDLGLGNAAKIR
ncbi:hypothetical protein [Nitrobacter sp.]|uniref:hypothetical protein n=1 Tax=Nitrobacter sp. TaxID=29420 RepID=UPI00399D78A8